MISYNIRILLYNKVLLVWPAMALLIIVGGLFYLDIHTVTATSFVVSASALELPSSIFTTQFISVVLLIAIIALPTHLVKNIESERAALLLSKPISRIEFILYDLAAVLAVCVIFTTITIIAFTSLLLIKTGAVSYYLMTALLFLPLQIITAYSCIMLLVFLSKSYAVAVFGVFFLNMLSAIVFKGNEMLINFGIESNLSSAVISVLYYLIPNYGGAEQLINQTMNSGTIDFGLLIFILYSCLPFLALAYIVFQRKEF